MPKYVVTLDYYTEDYGNHLEVLCSTCLLTKAQRMFRACVDQQKNVDIFNGWTVMDNTDTLYYSHGHMPEYCRVQLTKI